MISNILKGQQCGNSVASRCESDIAMIAMILFDKIRGESHGWSHHPSTGDGLKWASVMFFLLRGEDVPKWKHFEDVK